MRHSNTTFLVSAFINLFSEIFIFDRSTSRYGFTLIGHIAEF